MHKITILYNGLLSLALASFVLSPSVYGFSCPESRSIISKPIQFNAERVALTQDYQSRHYNIHTESIRINPKMIVLHFTATENLQQGFDHFNAPRLNATKRPELPDTLNVSSHFLVDRDGKIYQLMPVNWMARHVIGLNHHAIGIENIGGIGTKTELTPAQVEANAYLICELKKIFPGIQYLIGHQEYLKFQNTPLWLERDAHYRTQKHDPGENFMRQVRALIKHLGLRSEY